MAILAGAGIGDIDFGRLRWCMGRRSCLPAIVSRWLNTKRARYGLRWLNAFDGILLRSNGIDHQFRIE